MTMLHVAERLNHSHLQIDVWNRIFRWLGAVEWPLETQVGPSTTAFSTTISIPSLLLSLSKVNFAALLGPFRHQRNKTQCRFPLSGGRRISFEHSCGELNSGTATGRASLKKC